MLNFDCVDALWLDAMSKARAGNRTESRVGPCFETLGYSARLTDLDYNMVMNEGRNFSFGYAFAELLWYLSGTDDTTMLQAYAPSYHKYTEDGIHAAGAYGKRWVQDEAYSLEFNRNVGKFKFDFDDYIATRGLKAPITQLQSIAWLLSKTPDTRQAVMTCWNAGDLVRALLGTFKDIPCTLSLQFILRDKLNLVCTMRSNDVWMGMPYDIFCFTSIQKLLADSLDVEVGWYQHNVGSLHLYEKHVEKPHESGFNVSQVTFERHRGKLSDQIKEAVKMEAHNRSTYAFNYSCDSVFGVGTMLHQALAVMALYVKPCKRTLDNIRSPLKEILKERMNVDY